MDLAGLSQSTTIFYELLDLRLYDTSGLFITFFRKRPRLDPSKSHPSIFTLHTFDALFMHSLMPDLFIHCSWLFLLILMLHYVLVMFIARLNIINY